MTWLLYGVLFGLGFYIVGFLEHSLERTFHQIIWPKLRKKKIKTKAKTRVIGFM